MAEIGDEDTATTASAAKESPVALESVEKDEVIKDDSERTPRDSNKDDDVSPVPLETDSTSNLLDAIEKLDPINARRYEQSRRSHFDRKLLKRQMTATLQRVSKLRRHSSSDAVPVVSQRCSVVMAGLAKMFVADVTTRAREIMNARSETGPIRPRHYQEAWRQYSQSAAAQQTVYGHDTFQSRF